MRNRLARMLVTNLLGSAAAGGVTYLLRDEFTTNAGAPMATPRTCEPGPGSLNLTDTGSVLSISSNRLQWTAMTVSNRDPRAISASTLTRAAGVALAGIFNVSGRALVGWDTVTTRSPQTHAIQVAGGSALEYINPSAISITFDALTINTDYEWMIVLRGTGAIALIKGGSQFSEWSILWVDDTVNTSGMYPGVGVANGTSTCRHDDLRAAQLASPWTSDYGAVTNRTASPTTGDQLAHEANGIIEIIWTAATGATFELDVRRTDDDNRWIVRCDQAGSTIKLIERNAGVETERASSAQTWSNGTQYRIVSICYGNTIRNYVQYTAKGNYTSASFNNTATIAEINASAGAVSNFVTWPRMLSGTALSQVESI